MPSFLIYEGVSEDPMQQTMRLVDGESEQEVWERYKATALSIQAYVPEPAMQQALDEKKLRRGMPVWE